MGEEGEGERDRVNSVRTIVLPCGKVTKEKCERVHRREGVMEEKDGERWIEREKVAGEAGRGMSRFQMVISQLVQLLLCK